MKTYTLTESELNDFYDRAWVHGCAYGRGETSDDSGFKTILSTMTPNQPTERVVEEIDLTLDSDAVEAARGYLGEQDAEYLLGELNDIIAARLANRQGGQK